jgi:hypothetical protein
MRSKIAPFCISIEMVKLSFFFLSGVEVFQVLGVEVSHRRTVGKMTEKLAKSRKNQNNLLKIEE